MVKARKTEKAAVQGIWSGTISFSLVAIPVQLVRAVDSGRVSFRMLHSRDFSPLARRMYCSEDERIVPPEEIIRGFELGPDRYVLITDEELESVSPERSRTIEILEFIDMKEVDAVYFDHPYYLVPLKGGEKAYRLLAEVLARTGRAGLAKFVLGEREYLVAVYSVEGVLGLITLHYHEEVLSAEGLDSGDGAETAAKAGLDKTIRKMLTRFDPEKYADRRRKMMMDIIKKKVKEKAAVEAPHAEEAEGEGPADLVEALKESMRRVKEKR